MFYRYVQLHGERLKCRVCIHSIATAHPAAVHEIETSNYMTTDSLIDKGSL